MQIKIFTIPILGGEQINAEMNAFLHSNRVLKMERQLIKENGGAFWCFCIEYLDEAPPGNKKKVDYREVLDEASFRRFSEMRKIRKRLAEEEGVPPFVIFNDEEMAGLARIENLTLANMKSVKGIGDKKTEKYGRHFILKEQDEKSK